MSYTEVRQEGGMPFGGMPYDEVLYKQEETDPVLVSEVRGDDEFFDVEDHYNHYVRAEITDWTPDNTFLESDHPRRDPAIPRSILNLRYAGGRGPNDYRLPQHPELFLGFTGNDPRGVDNQPRLDKARGQMASRARELEVRMGHNVGHGGLIEADRPWSGPAIEYDKKEIQRRMKGYLHWFPAQKEGRPWGRNTVADEFYGLRNRHVVAKHGGEGMYVPEQDQPSSERQYYPGSRTQREGYAPVRGAETDGVRRVDRSRTADSAPWRNTTGDTELAVQKYTAAPGRRRETLSPSAVGGGVSVNLRSGQDFGVHQDAKSTNRRVLAGGMGTAASHRRALARASEGDTSHGQSAVAARVGRSAPELARDIAIAARKGYHDQTLRPFGQVQDHEGGIALGAGLGAPPGDRQSSLYNVHQLHPTPPNARLSNAQAMVRSLREGTSAQFRSVQGQIVSTTQMGTATSGTAGTTRGGLALSKDYIAVSTATRAPLSDGTMPGRREGLSKAPEFVSHTQAPTKLGDNGTFGAFGEYSGPHTGGLSIGSKSIRSTVLPDKGDDVLSVHGDGLGSGVSEAGGRV